MGSQQQRSTSADRTRGDETRRQPGQDSVAQALVAAASARGLSLTLPTDVVEVPGEGVSGLVDGHAAMVGGEDFVFSRFRVADRTEPTRDAGEIVVTVGLDGRLVMADPVREGTPALIDGLRRQGIAGILLATGGRAGVAERVTEGIGLGAVWADLKPEQKVRLVLGERRGGRVMTVGDGANDAPALAAADVGVAMGARGAAASAEAADVVLLVDRLDRLLPGIEVARGARRIALESVVVGIGLSMLGIGRRCLRPPDPGLGRAAGGGDRRGRHPEHPAGAPH